MRVFIILSVFAIAAPLTSFSATAADLSVADQDHYGVERQQRVRTVVRHYRRYVWKQIGMPCLLMPDEIVRRNWNGPQCRWADNL